MLQPHRDRPPLIEILGDRSLDSGARDPLLSALVDKLPPAGTPWPAADRQAWLDVMSRTFDIVYGGAAVASATRSVARATRVVASVARSKAKRRPQERPAARTRKPTPHGEGGPVFYIDKQGFARKRGGNRVLPAEVDGYIVDQRGEHGDISRIVWADDSAGIPRGKQLDITIG